MKHFRVITLIFTVLSLLIISSCQTVQEEPKAKYVFLFIGDGMGFAQVTAAEVYQAALAGNIYDPLVFSNFPVAGPCSNYANDRYITGSAASGTALATGHKTNIGRISMNADADSALTTITEKAKQKGMKVGIISSVSIDHATPAAFYAHQPSRNMYHEIALDLASSSFDFYGGGGFREPVREDVDVVELAKQNGFRYINTTDDFHTIQASDERVIFVHPELTNGAAMHYAIDQPEGYVTLARITEKAIEFLDNENGFFMMVEGGKIDWASHANDAATALLEVLDFADAVEVAVQFYKQHPEETLIVVTADHETGGLGLGYADSGYDNNYELLENQKMSGEEFNKLLVEWRKENHLNEKGFKIMLELIEDNFGIGREGAPVVLTQSEENQLKEAFMGLAISQESDYGDYSPLTYVCTQILSRRSGLGWTSRSHTGICIPVYATGVNENEFAPRIDNTDIPNIIWEAID